MPNVALFVAFVTATKEARQKYGDTNAPVIVHCRYRFNPAFLTSVKLDMKYFIAFLISH